MNKIYLKALGLWFLMAIIANFNGLIRNYGYAPIIGEYPGHIISTLILIIIFIILIGLFFRLIKGNYKNKDALFIAVAWALMTISFEFLFGHYIIGHSWKKLLADYNILEGRIWSLVLITTFSAPILWGRYYQEYPE